MLCVRTSAVAICAGFMLLMRAVVQVALQAMMCQMQWKILTLAAIAYFLSIVSDLVGSGELIDCALVHIGHSFL